MLNVKLIVNGQPTAGRYKGLLALVGDIEEELSLALRDSDKITLSIVVEQT